LAPPVPAPPVPVPLEPPWELPVAGELLFVFRDELLGAFCELELVFEELLPEL
jgi:hypothetical protein